MCHINPTNEIQSYIITGGQLFQLFARETNLKKQSSVLCTVTFDRST